MPGLLERAAAALGFAHARRVWARFERSLADPRTAQAQALERALESIRGSEFARKHGLGRVRTPDEFRRAVPLATFEDMRPWVERVAAGEFGALFAPHERVLMFALSSGTTALPKRVPVTRGFIRDYQKGWYTFGLKLLKDHPDSILRSILQVTGCPDEERTPAGIPCGAITGQLALMQKGIVRHFYVAGPEITHVTDAAEKYYILMRLAAERDVAFAVTANPATLLRMALLADERSEDLIRDVSDGTITASGTDAQIVRRLARRLRPNRRRAAELAALRRAAGRLRPADYWRLSFLVCWTGGSFGYYLDRVADWWGNVPLRDAGLMASEGRVTLPFEDGTPAGVLAVDAGYFEFIPADQVDRAQPQTLHAWELEEGASYATVLTNRSGLTRYRLDDVVRVRGRLGNTPKLEFLHRAGGVASVAGEKLTEHQVVEAVTIARRKLGLPEFDFVLYPRLSDTPFYQLACPIAAPPELAHAIDVALGEQNIEYQERRHSLRLERVQLIAIDKDRLGRLLALRAARRRSGTEQAKPPCLLTDPSDAAVLFG